MERLLAVLIFCGGIVLNGRAVELPFIPRVVHYSVHDYLAGNQNWAVAQDKKGVIYVANTKGLLEFDGGRWQLYPLSSGGIVRSVFVAEDGRIYVGSFEEFGYFVRDRYNRLEYHSLKEQVTGFDFNNDEIWNIVADGSSIYFQTFSSYFHYDGQQVRGIKMDELPLNFLKTDHLIFTQLINGDFSVFNGMSHKKLISREKVGNDDVVAVLPLDKRLLFITRNSGIFCYDGTSVYAWKTAIDRELALFSVNKAVMTRDSVYVLGTLSDGIYALGKEGELKWKINTDSKLPNNTVLGLLCDAENNIWAALDNGIAFIHHNSGIYLFEPATRRMGMVYDVAVGEEESYIASNHGLYRYTDKLDMVPGSEEQAWTITNIDGQLICGHNKGSFQVGEGKFSSLSDVRGAFCTREVTVGQEEVLLQGTYTYLSVFRRDVSGQWRFSNTVDGFLHPVRHLEVDHLGNIWAKHMYKGLFRIQLDRELKKAVAVQCFDRLGSRERDAVSVFKLRGRVVFSDGKEFYTYQDLADSIVSYKQMNDELPGLADVYRIVPVTSNSWWFISDRRFTLVDYRDGHFARSRQYSFSMFDNPPVDGQGNIKVDRVSGYSYVCLNGAVARLDLRKEQAWTMKPELRITEVAVWNDREEHKVQRLPLDEQMRVGNDYNNIRINLATSSWQENSGVIRYQLLGFSPDWTTLTGMQKVYTRLPYGHYCFKAEMYDDDNLLLATVDYPFTVERPWYLSYLAFSLYLILFVAGLMLVWWLLQKRKDAVVHRQRMWHAMEMDKQQQRIVALQNEQLESELRFKSKELSSVTMLNLMNKEFLAQLKDDLLKQRMEGQFSRKSFDKIIRTIDENIKSDEEWQMFQSNFDRIHENFFRNLKLRYPELTPNDLRLCAFLRLNMPTKDIAKLMNISPRGVEAARYRLRKKLDIPMEKNLIEFMIEFR